MGFNKLFLPEAKELKEFLTTHGKERFHDRWVLPYKKRDAVIGPNDAFEFIKQFIDCEYNNKPDNQFNAEVGQ